MHSALWLVLTMLCLGCMYLTQGAEFLGFVQIIVYTGAIMMLFLFVLMLTGRDAGDSVVEALRASGSARSSLGIGVVGLLVTGPPAGLPVDISVGLEGGDRRPRRDRHHRRSSSSPTSCSRSNSPAPC